VESPKGVGGDSAGQLRRGAKARIVTGESILFVKERHGDGTQFWILPGAVFTLKSLLKLVYDGRCKKSSIVGFIFVIGSVKSCTHITAPKPSPSTRFWIVELPLLQW
jgi:hypothetical protein